MSKRFRTLSFIIIAFIGFSCGGDDNKENANDNFDRKAVLVNMADNLIVPAYEDLNSSSITLKNAASALANESNSENVDKLHEAWAETLTNWQWAALYDFGPASENALISVFNLYPVSEEKINDNIASGNYNLESGANINATGLQAIDYILNGAAEENGDAAAYFQNNPAAAQYILNITTLLNSKSETVLSTWNNGYRDTFVNASGTDLGSSLGQLLNGAIKYYEIYLRDGKVGIPAGARSSTGLPMPEQSEAYYDGEISKSLLQNGIQAWKAMFNGNGREGTPGEGLDDYLIFLGPTFEGNPLHEGINNRFEQSLELANDLGSPLKNSLSSEQQVALDLFDELQRVVVLLKVDMTSAMGIQVTYVDNDGD